MRIANTNREQSRDIQLTVVAGFSSFTAPALVPSMMKALVSDFNDDIRKAEENGELDSYFLAAKYFHKFVNIHSFLDGNWLVCRLILNAVLLKYAGIIVTLGEKEDDRKKYLEIAQMASMDEQILEDGGSRKPWANLASYVSKKGMEKMGTLRDTLKNAA